MWLATNAGPFLTKHIELSVGIGKPLRILHISDLHFAPGQKAKANFLKELAELKPDLVVNTGDNLGHRDAVGPTLKALAPLMHFPGVFVNGSNDYRAPQPRNPLGYFLGPSKVREERDLDTASFTEALKAAGWLGLNNQAGTLEVAGSQIGFLGLDDPHENLDDLDSLTLQREETKDSDLVLAVAHAPYLRVLEAFAEKGAAVAFAGHTHGGQVCLPGQKALVTNCDLPTKYAQGLSGWKFGNREILAHVSGGIGCSIHAPLRVFCPPSATLLTLN
ncbi:MAG: hypothetical protein RJB32_433 [Actinomycetota bacterium]|jgi:predicted MPP superfamily phosphohydrolase